jgi:hypothetical protein
VKDVNQANSTFLVEYENKRKVRRKDTRHNTLPPC